ncbi:dihydrofolate reductase [Bacillus sp. 165]|uniref:dihydrofolate reductase n=1 Tax=Bacillus sp. 165 TaxID=1529117 RepID=UPI001AD99892|nr:dihydrofolate reductase [Bacillus sp. 165]MBO9129348.1 dihydrofolate reductase [Bacillus sp. 165]
MISLIWAMDDNCTIGKNNDLPWRLPADLGYFKKVTYGHPVVMGRKTYESIGKPLPGRENIVVTRNKEYQPEGVTVVHSLEEVQAQEKDVFVIGGAQLYKQALPLADRLYVTHIHEVFEGDTYFPQFEKEEWQVITQEQGIRDEKNPYDYEFVVYERQK